ncbi:O-antigen ligase family protein [Sphingomonas adhaesiva]|uniref:O-antigen ligase family protein n=1 Tax=Sphingomonas adhaesiva TaxID=28212 RepID=UPI002FF4EA95
MAINSGDLHHTASYRRVAPIGSDLSAAILFCLSTVILGLELAQALGAVVPVGVLGCCVLMMVLMREKLATAGRTIWLTIFPVFCLLSTLWSDGSRITFYYSIQLIITVLSAYLVYLAVDLRRFLVVLLLSSAAICMFSILSGKMGPSTKGPVLVGLTGSKNAMAACANLALFAGIAVLFAREQAWPSRLVALATIPMALFIISTTRAATFILLSGVMPLFLLAFLTINWLPVRARLPIILLILLIAAAGIVAAPAIIAYAQDEVFTTFGKDQTLTGRTYLWEVAREWAQERPWFGWGYKYQWMSYSPGAIGMLRSQQLVDARTFSLHQSFLEAQVDTGYVGLALLVATIAIGTVASLWRALFDGGIATAFAATLLLSLIIRAFGETLFGPFYAYGPITFALLCYAIKPHDADVQPTRWRRRYVSPTFPDEASPSGARSVAL